MYDTREKEIIRLYTIKKFSARKIGRILHMDKRAILKKLRNFNIPIKQYYHKYKDRNNNYFDKIDTENKAYFLGLLYADGSNSIKNGKISIALQARDKDILNKMVQDMLVIV